MQHSPYGPSAGDRWVRCLRSFYLHKNNFKSSVYADEGTVGHWLGEQCLLDPKRRPEDWLDEVITCNTHPDLAKLQFNILVTEEICEAVQEYIDHVTYILDTIGDGGMIYKLEKRVKLTEECWGTTDTLILDKAKRRLYIIDLKMGRGVSVQATNNYQLRIYGAAALHMVDPLMSWYPTEVYMQIIQPRVMGEPTLREEIMSADDLLAWSEKPKAAIKLIQENIDTPENLPLVPGEKQCRWCSKSASCKKSAEYTLAKAGLEFQAFAEGDSKIPPTELLTGEEIGNILAGLPMLDTWKKAIQAEALERVKKGGIINGFKVVESTKFRQYVDAKEAELYLKKYLPEEKLYTKKMLTPAQAEKALGKKSEECKQFTDLHIFKPEGDPQLAPESSNKPAMKFSAMDEFAGFVGDKKD